MRPEKPAVLRERKTVTQHRFTVSWAVLLSQFLSYALFDLWATVSSVEERFKKGDRNKEFSEYVRRSPNRSVLLTVRLAAALRFFADGEAYDIACMFGVSHTVVFENIDMKADEDLTSNMACSAT